MKEIPSKDSRKKRAERKVAVAAATVIAAASIAIGVAIVPENLELPVVLSNGELISQPWYVTVEGENVAIVNTEEEAKEVIKEVADQYQNDQTLDLKIEENTEAKEVDLKNGADKPEILSVEAAAKQIEKKDTLTVVTTEVVTCQEQVDFIKKKEKSDKLYVGQSKVKEKGEKGVKKITKKVIRQNGQAVKEEVKDEELLKKPEEEIILTGTKVPEPTEEKTAAFTASRSGGRMEDSSGQFVKPVSEFKVTSPFGPRWGKTHRGVDLGMPSGASIYAADGGTVIQSGYSGSYGNLVKVDHGNGTITYYAHCSKLLTSQGQTVSKGQEIAKVGSTGNSTGPHLHFEVLVNGTNVNPMNYF